MKKQFHKKEFIARYAQENGISKVQAAEEISRFVDTLSKTLSDGIGVQFIGFGSFVLRYTKPTTSVVQIGPRKGQTAIIPEHYALKFVPSDNLRQSIKNLDVE